MRFVLVNRSDDTNLTNDVLEAIRGACLSQLYNEYASHWQAYGIPIDIGSPTDTFEEDQCVVQIVDTDNVDALGYHSTNGVGRPDILINWNLIASHGGTLTVGSNSLSVCLSHELLECSQNPYTNKWYDVALGVQQAAELCDPVQSESYAINGVYVSNFVRPRYFDYGPGPFSHIETIHNPFSMSPGGYKILRDAKGVRDVFARDESDGGVPEWSREAKRLSKKRWRLRGGD